MADERFNSVSYRVVEGLQIYAGCYDILMAQYRLYRCYRSVFAGCNGCCEMAYTVEGKRLYAGLFA